MNGEHRYRKRHDNNLSSKFGEIIAFQSMKSALSRIVYNPTALVRYGIAIVAVLLTCWTQWVPHTGEWNFANEWLRDRFIRVRADTVPDPRILVVDIDESSLREFGPWPWQREKIASLVEILLVNYGARGVALDIVLPEPGDQAGDARLAKLAEFGPVVLAQAFDYGVQPLPLRIGKLTGDSTASWPFPAIPADGYIANHAGLAHATHFGNIGVIPDPDGTLRRLPLVTRFDNRNYPTLSLALLDCCSQGPHQVTTPNNEGFYRVPFKTQWDAFTGVRAADILNTATPAEEVKGRLVLIGSSALGLTDRIATPLQANTPGLLVHAAALSSMLDEQEGTAAKAWPGRWIAIVYSAFVALFAMYAFSRLSALSSISLLAACSLAWLGLAYLIYPHDPNFSTTGPLASNLFLLAVAVPFNWQIAQSRSKRLLGTLRQYVARAVVDELLRSDMKDPLAPRQLSVTTLIADMEGYTKHVGSLSIEEAAEVTRSFLDCLTRPVLEHQGTLDKYTGDGLVAFWGAPLPDAEHANHALDAARAMMREVELFSQSRQQAGKPPVRVRIGVESGTAMAGDFGSSFRSLYTAVGDSVNVASRLEDAARDFPYDVIVGPGTAKLVDRHRLIALGERVLRGKDYPTQLFALDPSA